VASEYDWVLAGGRLVRNIDNVKAHLGPHKTVKDAIEVLAGCLR
jgi:hypothetical protein